MSESPKAFEDPRGCGLRQVGKLYLVGKGITYVCPSLPLIFKECDCCGYIPPQYRDYQWIKKAYIKHIRAPTGTACQPNCPVCYPGTNDQARYGLMWVGRKFYTPQTFIDEAKGMTVSKAIKQIPKGLILGKTWVMLAHPDAYVDTEDPDYGVGHQYWIERGIDDNKSEPKPPTYPGVFFAFIPQKVEVLVYENDTSTVYLAELEEKGITPVIIPNEYDGHRTRHRRVKTRRNIPKKGAD